MKNTTRKLQRSLKTFFTHFQYEIQWISKKWKYIRNIKIWVEMCFQKSKCFSEWKQFFTVKESPSRNCQVIFSKIQQILSSRKPSKVPLTDFLCFFRKWTCTLLKKIFSTTKTILIVKTYAVDHKKVVCEFFKYHFSLQKIPQKSVEWNCGETWY